MNIILLHGSIQGIAAAHAGRPLSNMKLSWSKSAPKTILVDYIDHKAPEYKAQRRLEIGRDLQGFFCFNYTRQSASTELPPSIKEWVKQNDDPVRMTGAQILNRVREITKENVSAYEQDRNKKIQRAAMPVAAAFAFAAIILASNAKEDPANTSSPEIQTHATVTPQPSAP